MLIANTIWTTYIESTLIKNRDKQIDFQITKENFTYIPIYICILLSLLLNDSEKSQQNTSTVLRLSGKQTT